MVVWGRGQPDVDDLLVATKTIALQVRVDQPWGGNDTRFSPAPVMSE